MTVLEADVIEVMFAFHLVAGRMPGHLNVLLAEVDIPYDILYEMQDINEDFKDADVVIVIGSNDVVNPSANTAEGTPIYGMPILDVEDAKSLIMCNYDTQPGYAGVDNPLYEGGREHIALMLGDAKETLGAIMSSYREGDGTDEVTPSGEAMTTELQSGTWLRDAERVIIVPGYGMALSQAQSAVKQLMTELEQEGKEVSFAIHPVAGRMPGHMNVLLAEVDIPYDKLKEMDEVNPEFKNTDVAIIIGANDVINPAANTAEGTPIYGMPILDVEDAKHVIICNFDKLPGYAGVDNPLYEEGRTARIALMLGDAKETLDAITKAFRTCKVQPTVHGATASPEQKGGRWLADAARVIIVPGYGMALSQAQSTVKSLMMELEQQGKEVKFAIHPVAGRMPGHMNVLLAEVDVPYDKLYEMQDINPEFEETDVAIIIGANDVINPAANTAEGTPIYGMPILDVEDAKHVIICNFDKLPGYAGVDNPLYEEGHEDHIALL